MQYVNADDAKAVIDKMFIEVFAVPRSRFPSTFTRNYWIATAIIGFLKHVKRTNPEYYEYALDCCPPSTKDRFRAMCVCEPV